jgi:hypothetical protein
MYGGGSLGRLQCSAIMFANGCLEVGLPVYPPMFLQCLQTDVVEGVSFSS